jgi:hypothetical protein
VPHYSPLIFILTRALHRLSAAGEIDLTNAEAQLLRGCGFVTGTSGLWKIPPLPLALVRGNGLPLSLAAAPSAVSPPSRDPGPAGMPSGATSQLQPSVSPWSSRYSTIRRTEAERALAWFWYRATPDQRRIILSLLRQPDGRSKKRALQQRMERLRAVRFNSTLQELITRGVIHRDGTTLSLSAELYSALLQAGLAVRHRPQAPTQARKQKPRKRLFYEDRDGHVRSLPASTHGRRTLAPAGTSLWGRQMLAKRGGLARQRQCRALGINPTAAATAARLAGRMKLAAPRTSGDVTYTSSRRR